jgi:DNA repair photolyase
MLSVSRRTDIPLYYSEWFFNRLKAGFVYVRNPMNYNQISKIPLDKTAIDCIVFWTKNPKNMMSRLDELNEYKYYLQFTLNPYGKDIELNTIPAEERVEIFKELSEKIGSDRVIWRYDPIIMNDRLDIAYHEKNFKKLAKELNRYTRKCVISFLDPYKKVKLNLKSFTFNEISEEDMIEISKIFIKIAKEFNLEIETCSEKIDLSGIGIKHGKCIDDCLISNIIGQKIIGKKDKNQRKECGCIESIDIGAYNTCINGCLYCYASFNHNQARKNFELHNPKSPIIIGEVSEEEKKNIKLRKLVLKKNNQLDFDNL